MYLIVDNKVQRRVINDMNAPSITLAASPHQPRVAAPTGPLTIMLSDNTALRAVIREIDGRNKHCMHRQCHPGKGAAQIAAPAKNHSRAPTPLPFAGALFELNFAAGC